MNVVFLALLLSQPMRSYRIEWLRPSAYVLLSASDSQQLATWPRFAKDPELLHLAHRVAVLESQVDILLEALRRLALPTPGIDESITTPPKLKGTK